MIVRLGDFLLVFLISLGFLEPSIHAQETSEIPKSSIENCREITRTFVAGKQAKVHLENKRTLSDLESIGLDLSHVILAADLIPKQIKDEDQFDEEGFRIATSLTDSTQPPPSPQQLEALRRFAKSMVSDPAPAYHPSLESWLQMAEESSARHGDSEDFSEFENLVRGGRWRLYNHQPAAVPISKELETQTRNPEDAFRYFVSNVSARGPAPVSDLGPFMYETLMRAIGFQIRPHLVGRISGEQVRMLLGGPPNWTSVLWQKNYPPKPDKKDSSEETLRSSYFKIYITIPPDLMKSEIPSLITKSKSAGASAFKFMVTAPEGRNDRIVIHFEDFEKGLRLAQELQRDYEERKIEGQELPLSYRMGNSPVFIQVDLEKTTASQPGSARENIARQISVASVLWPSPNKRRAELAARFLRFKGIDPLTMLPIDSDLSSRLNKQENPNKEKSVGLQ